MGLPTVLAAVGTALSIGSAVSQRNAEQKAAKEKKEIGELEAKQYLNDMFLGRAAAIDAGNRRMEEMQQTENQNIAAFSAMGRDDRSVDAYLKRNRELAGRDLVAIEKTSEIEMAKKVTEAAVARTYGQNAAAGIRAQSNANLLSNLSDIAQNVSTILPKSTPKTPASKDK